MQMAMILSDLKSLSVCVRILSESHGFTLPLTDRPSQGHEEGLKLVNTHKLISTSDDDRSIVSEKLASPAVADGQRSTDPDLQRARDLVELHYGLKMKHLEGGLDKDLQKARDDVKRVSRMTA
jgi:hypothetical protein